MFRIRRIHDDSISTNREAIAQVQDILRSQFGLLPEKDIAKIPEQLQNPLKYRFRSILFAAEDSKGHVNGFALLCHAPFLNFCYLDFIATEKQKMGKGIGEALYQRVREESLSLKVIGLFFECLPDDSRIVPTSRYLQTECGALALLRKIRRPADCEHLVRNTPQAGVR